MITLTYTAPSDGDATMSGTWSDGTTSGSFQTAIIYVNDVMDISATETKVKTIIQQDLSQQSA